jgi:hypothetical protein
MDSRSQKRIAWVDQCRICGASLVGRGTKRVIDYDNPKLGYICYGEHKNKDGRGFPVTSAGERPSIPSFHQGPGGFRPARPGQLTFFDYLHCGRRLKSIGFNTFTRRLYYCGMRWAELTIRDRL